MATPTTAFRSAPTTKSLLWLFCPAIEELEHRTFVTSVHGSSVVTG
jgi:hypothetical protein